MQSLHDIVTTFNVRWDVLFAGMSFTLQYVCFCEVGGVHAGAALGS